MDQELELPQELQQGQEPQLELKRVQVPKPELELEAEAFNKSTYFSKSLIH